MNWGCTSLVRKADRCGNDTPGEKVDAGGDGALITSMPNNTER